MHSTAETSFFQKFLHSIAKKSCFLMISAFRAARRIGFFYKNFIKKNASGLDFRAKLWYDKNRSLWGNLRIFPREGTFAAQCCALRLAALCALPLCALPCFAPCRASRNAVLCRSAPCRALRLVVLRALPCNAAQCYALRLAVLRALPCFAQCRALRLAALPLSPPRERPGKEIPLCFL